jgi:hypothetical protein
LAGDSNPSRKKNEAIRRALERDAALRAVFLLPA